MDNLICRKPLLLNYTIDDFTPSGNLCYINEIGDILHETPLHELFNLSWYIQHLIDERGHEFENPFSEKNWMNQTNWKFIKYVNHNKHSMTPKETCQTIIKVKQHEELDTEDGESNKDEEEFTTSSEISEEESTSDTTTETTEESQSTETLQVHNVCNTTINDENDSLEDENVTKIETYIGSWEQNNETDVKLLTTNFEIKVENQKVEGHITYSTYQQVFKFEVNS